MARDYTITDQRQTTDLSSSGRFVDVMEVSFETVPEGVPGKLTVPLAQYNPENIGALVSARVAQIKAVHNL